MVYKILKTYNDATVFLSINKKKHLDWIFKSLISLIIIK